MEQFILTDIGSHILDVARFLFGDASNLYCQTARIHHDIKGEDVATVMIRMGTVTCTCELSYASILEHDPFPQTLLLVELGADYWVRVTTAEGTVARRYPPPRYGWADPAYALVHASIVPCNANILQALRSGERAETDAEDNIKTVRLVFGAYDSSRRGQAVVV